MLFTQPIFIGFFVLVFLAHWTLRGNAPRKLLLLLASYGFYAAWDWRFLFLIVASTVIDFVVGLVLAVPLPRGGRRFWLAVSLIGNLGILGFFKYYNFFVTSAHSALELAGFQVPEMSLHIILPVGISFFTFQSMSYSFDIYRGRLTAIRNFVDFSLYVAFFPQLVAGPIVRARDFLPQLSVPRQLAAVPFKAAIALFLIGMIFISSWCQLITGGEQTHEGRSLVVSDGAKQGLGQRIVVQAVRELCDGVDHARDIRVLVLQLDEFCGVRPSGAAEAFHGFHGDGLGDFKALGGAEFFQTLCQQPRVTALAHLDRAQRSFQSIGGAGLDPGSERGFAEFFEGSETVQKSHHGGFRISRRFG